MRQGLPSRCVGGLSISHDLGGDLSGTCVQSTTVSPGGVRDRSGQNGNVNHARLAMSGIVMHWVLLCTSSDEMVSPYNAFDEWYHHSINGMIRYHYVINVMFSIIM